jgi:hypothetical protein
MTANPAMLTVFDDRRCLGFILSRGAAGFEAFSAADEKSLGLHSDQAAAAAALRNASAGGSR